MASRLDFLPLPEAATEVEGALRLSEDGALRQFGDEALCRSGDGALHRSSLLEEPLSFLDGRSSWLRPSRPRASSFSALMNRVARAISYFIVATGYMTNCARSSMPGRKACWKDLHQFLQKHFRSGYRQSRIAGELGDILVLSHPKGHKVGICLWDALMCLEFF